MADSSSIKNTIKDLLKSRDYLSLESVWLQYVDSLDYDLPFIEQLIQRLINSGHIQLASDLVSFLVNEYAAAKEYQQVLECLHLLEHHGILNESFRKPLVTAIKALHPHSKNLDHYFLYSAIDTTSELGTALHQLEEFLFYDIGEVFRHNSWGIGVV
jgi:transcription elongation factor GreA-like protein